MDIKKLRKETPGAEKLIHFNNAGAALVPKQVNEAIIKWIQEEEITGGYEMEERYQESIAKIYDEIALLIQCEKDEIAITDNASTAFSKALYSIPFRAGDEIITSEIEYGNNFLNYLKLKKDKGIHIKLIPKAINGPIDLEKLKQAITTKTKLIAITHMPTSSGAIAPVEEIGEIAQEHDILYMVDTCQSIGHYPTFVDEIKCDFLNGTSRKYLRGPRGLGFLYARKSLYKKLDPYMLEAMGAAWESTEKYDLNQTIKMFECFEKPYGFMMGFQAAINYANQLGIHTIWDRIRKISTYARSQWHQVPGLSLHDGDGDELSGIVTLTLKNHTPEALHSYFRKNHVNSSICKPFTSYTDMKSKNLQASNRLSLHYYNTEEEVDQVTELLKQL